MAGLWLARGCLGAGSGQAPGRLRRVHGRLLAGSGQAPGGRAPGGLRAGRLIAGSRWAPGGLLAGSLPAQGWLWTGSGRVLDRLRAGSGGGSGLARGRLWVDYEQTMGRIQIALG